MLQQIKIMLGLCHEDQRDVSRDNYDSFLDDLKSGSNKTRPQLDDHNLVSRLVKLIRGDYEPSADTLTEAREGDEKPLSEGFVHRLRQRLHKDQ